MFTMLPEINTQDDELLEHLVLVNPVMNFKSYTVIKLKYESIADYTYIGDNSKFVTFNLDDHKVNLYIKTNVIYEDEGHAIGTLYTYNPMQDSFLVRFPPISLSPYQASFSRSELYQLYVPFKNGSMTCNFYS